MGKKHNNGRIDPGGGKKETRDGRSDAEEETVEETRGGERGEIFMREIVGRPGPCNFFYSF